MTFTTKIGAAMLALAAAAPLEAQVSSQGWLVGPLVKREVSKNFWGPKNEIVPEHVGPQTFAPGETIARAAFRRPSDSYEGGPGVLGAILTYAGRNGPHYLVDFTCNFFAGYDPGSSVGFSRTLTISEPATLSLMCPAIPSTIEQPSQKIELRVLRIDENANATFDVKVLPLYTEKPR